MPLEQRVTPLLNMKRGSSVKEKRKKNEDVSEGLTASTSGMLTRFQVKKQPNGRRMAKIRTRSSHINRTAHHLLITQLKDSRLLIILLHLAKSTLASRLPLPASSILAMSTHHQQVTHLPCQMPTLLLPERLDILRNLGKLGGLMRM